jgi:hypothetical protein
MDELNELEARRVALENFRRRFRLFAVIFAAAALAIGAFLARDGEFHDSNSGKQIPGAIAGAGIAIFPAVLVPFVAWHFTGAKKKSAFNAAFKDGVVAAELRGAFGAVDYRPDGAFTKDFIEGLGVFKGFDKARGGDCLRAAYRGYSFESADLSLIVVEEYTDTDTDSDGDEVIKKRDVSVFEGSIAALELPSHCPARLLVCARGMAHAKDIPKRGEGRKEMSIFGNSAAKSLDSLMFTREYGVLSDDEAKGSAMLTARMTEALRKLDENIPGRFAVLREDKKLYLIVSGENSFEVHSGKNSASISEQQKRVADEVKRLTGRLDLLLEMEE